MFSLTNKHLIQVSGGVVTVAGYSFETPGVNQTYAELLAKDNNWGVAHGCLIGIICEGNPHQVTIFDWDSKGTALYYHFLKKSVPSSFYEEDFFA
jgi:hypothetical protein